jgi:hypothetical protein
MADIVSFAISLIIQTIILAPALWFVGGSIAKKEDVKFTDAVWIVVLGAVVSGIMGFFNLGLVGVLAGFVIWLFLIKHFFDTGWLKSFIISVLTTILLIIIAAVLALIGLGALLLM